MLVLILRSAQAGIGVGKADRRARLRCANSTELVRRKMDVIVAGGSTPAALAAKAATETIPIVFLVGGKDRTAADEQRTDALLHQNRKGRVDFARSTGVQGDDSL